MSDDDLPYWSAHEFAGLPYRYFAPPGPPGRGALLLFLHGIGERGKDNKAQLSYGFFRDPESLFSPAHLIANHCHVLAPQCPLFGKWANINLWFLPVHMAAAPTPSLATVWQLLAAYRRNPAIRSDARLSLRALDGWLWRLRPAGAPPRAIRGGHDRLRWR